MAQSESSSTQPPSYLEQAKELNELRSELQETLSIVTQNNFLELNVVKDNLIAHDNEFQIKSEVIFRAYDLYVNNNPKKVEFSFVKNDSSPDELKVLNYDNILNKLTSKEGAQWLIEKCQTERKYIPNVFLPAIFGGYTTKSRCQKRKELIEALKKANAPDELLQDLFSSFFFWEPGFIKNLYIFINQKTFDFEQQDPCSVQLLSSYEKALSFCSQDLHDILLTYSIDQKQYIKLLIKILGDAIDFLKSFYTDEFYENLKVIVGVIAGIESFTDSSRCFLKYGFKLTLNGQSTTVFNCGVSGDIIVSQYDLALLADLFKNELGDKNRKILAEKQIQDYLKDISRSKMALIHLKTMPEFAPQVSIDKYPDNWKKIYAESKQNKTDFLKSIDNLYYIEGVAPMKMYKICDNYYIELDIKRKKDELAKIISLVKDYKKFEQDRAIHACEQLTSIQCDQEFILTYYKYALDNLSLTARMLFKKCGQERKKTVTLDEISFDYSDLKALSNYANTYLQKEKPLEEPKK